MHSCEMAQILAYVILITYLPCDVTASLGGLVSAAACSSQGELTNNFRPGHFWGHDGTGSAHFHRRAPLDVGHSDPGRM